MLYENKKERGIKMTVNQSKKNDPRFWKKWRESGAVEDYQMACIKNEIIARSEETVGTAYAFFYCAAPKPDVKAELPFICELAQTPSALELALVKGPEKVQGDERLTGLAQDAKQAGINYVLQATYPGETNQRAADEVAALLNQAYQTPLYQPNDPFCGQVVYEENGEYVFRE
ncbi:MAG: hypothetical protein Q8R53_03250 [Nanoarchaeota archaeon]|nr:hypothetical protein [Nanoarchaeota archaeon]